MEAIARTQYHTYYIACRQSLPFGKDVCYNSEIFTKIILVFSKVKYVMPYFQFCMEQVYRRRYESHRSSKPKLH